MKFLERSRGDTDPTIHGDLTQACQQKIPPPRMDRNVELEVSLLDQHPRLPKRDRRNSEIVRLVGFIDRFSGFCSKAWICAVEPKQDVGVEQNQRSASQASSTGDMMSPQIVNDPRWRPKSDDERSG